MSDMSGVNVKNLHALKTYRVKESKACLSSPLDKYSTRYLSSPLDKYSTRYLSSPLDKYRSRDKAEIYGAIIRSINNRYALVQGRRSGKWSFPKGHANPGESPFDCVVREISEEIGIDRLPMPTTSLSLQVGYYYLFDVKEEFIMNTRDTNEVMNTGWFTKEEIKTLQVNVDLSKFIMH